MHDTIGLTRAARVVDNTDWLKTAAIILVAVDHFGHFFIDNNLWWSAFGRFAAPPFFFLLGYAHARTVPVSWIGLGVILTLLESWNAGWTWVSPNIFFSFVLIRLARPHVELLMRRHGWIALAFLVLALLAAVPVGGPLVDYGAEGWLWALLGLCQRMHVDEKSAAGAVDRTAPVADAISGSAGHMRLLACLVAAAVYIWQEQREYSFPPTHLAVFVVGVGVLSLIMCLFRRGPSYLQPPAAAAVALGFIGRRTLEIYAIQLAGFEIITLLR
jgi:hypothetical protein